MLSPHHRKIGVGSHKTEFSKFFCLLQVAQGLRVRRIDSIDRTVYNWHSMRRVDPTYRWRGGRVAEGGGLLNKMTWFENG